MNSNSTYKKTINDFKNKTVLVLGDLMIDQWVWGKVTRISPEAPVPVVDVDSYTFTPGGAANVVNNLRALGAKVILAGMVGRDYMGQKLKRDLKHKGVDVKGVLVDHARPTTIKTRIVAHSQQVVRADYEKKGRIPETINKDLIKYLKSENIKPDCLLISDYNKGVVNQTILSEVIPNYKKRNIRIIAGPKPANINLFKDVNIIALNQGEASQSSGVDIHDEKSLKNAGEKLLKMLDADAVLITRGEKGMCMFDKKGKINNIDAIASQVYDVSGAGDTVISVFSLAVSSGAKLLEATILSNIAAAIVVKKIGTATVNTQELITHLSQKNEL